MNPLSINPWALLGGAVLAAAVGFGAGWQVNGWRLGAEHEQEAAERAHAENAALLAQVNKNDRIREQQQIVNRRITKEYQDELAKVRADIARVHAGGLRVGPAICAGFAAGAETSSAGRGDGVDSGGRLVRPDVGRDIEALKLEVEKALAAGRACQQFVTANGMAP